MSDSPRFGENVTTVTGERPHVTEKPKPHMFGRVALLTALALAVLLAGAAAVRTPDQTFQRLVLAPSGDTYVGKGSADQAHGADPLLRLDTAPAPFVALIQFDVPLDVGFNATATFRIHAASRNALGASVVTVRDDGDVESATWQTRPRSEQVLGLLPANSTAEWVELDVSGAVAPGEHLVMALYARGPTMATYHSREVPDLAPELVLVSRVTD